MNIFYFKLANKSEINVNLLKVAFTEIDFVQ